MQISFLKGKHLTGLMEFYLSWAWTECLFVLILGETIVRNNSVDQAIDGRDGMAKVCGFCFYVAKVW